MFKRHKEDTTLEVSFKTIIPLIENLSKRDYNRLKEAMDLGYDAIQKLRNVKSIDEREVEDIDKIEKKLNKVVKKEMGNA